MTEAGYCRVLLAKKDTQITRLESEITKLRIEYEKQIVELQKENAELKEKNKWYSEQVCNKECAEVWKQLSKAKEIMQKLIANAPNTYSGTNIELQQKKMFSFQVAVNKAEQFLSEVEK